MSCLQICIDVHYYHTAPEPHERVPIVDVLIMLIKKRSGEGGGGSGEHKAWVRYRLSYKHAPDLTVRLNLAEVIKKKRWEIKVWRKRGKKWHWLRKRLEPTTWKMVSHALANWASESLGNSVAEFEHLRLSCQGSSRSRYQLACSMGRV